MEHDQTNIEEIFSAARQISDPSDRVAYLDQTCGSDAALRARVDKLLAALDEVGSFLEVNTSRSTPPGADETAARNATAKSMPLSAKLGTVIGRYKLLQSIGEGGFGSVYMAEQQEPVRRKVALKIIKLGMDTKQVIARFEAERQALAMMDHPNIAKVLDAGATESGRPYFVMELVKGVPITEYCDRNHLSTKERLDLFILVCGAVQHAHQKGVIHRDIKPSNVMVTLHDGKPVPKVIDFGIAKATAQRLTEKTLFTEYNQLVGTPLYMSPEQAEMSGLDIDTRTDIYSLGVLLYELLTGTTPFDAKMLRQAAYAEIQRIIREVEPPKPSTRLSSLAAGPEEQKTGTGPSESGSSSLAAIAKHRHTNPSALSRLIRGDLDWIVMKALEKDRARRYETANDFARDVEHHLANKPVVAGRPGAVYRFQKFIKRNRVEVTAVSLLAFALLLITLVVTTAAVQNYLRLTRLSTISEQGLADAELAMARANYSVAQRELTYIKGQLADEPGLLAKYEPQMEAVLRQADLKLRLDRFTQLADEARFSGPSTISDIANYFGWTDQRLAEHLSDAHRRYSDALAIFDVVDNRQWMVALVSVPVDPGEFATLKTVAAEMLILLAQVEFRLGEVSGGGTTGAHRAIEFLDQAEALGSNLKALYRYRSTYWDALGEHEAALADTERADRMSASGWVDHWLLALKLWPEWKHAEAMEELEDALALKVDEYWVWYIWGMWAAFEGYPQSQIHQAMSICIGLRPKEAAAWIGRGWRGRQPGDAGREAALTDLAKGLTLATDPGLRGMAHSARSVILAELGQTDAALLELDEAAHLLSDLQVAWDPWLPHDGPVGYDTWMMGHGPLGYNAWQLEPDRMEAALRYLSRLVELRPEKPGYLFTRAYWHMTMGQRELGQVDVRNVLEMYGEPTTFNEHMRRIHALELAELWRDVFRACLEMKAADLRWNTFPYGMYPNLANAYRRLGRTYLDSGQFDEDLKPYEESVRIDITHSIAWVLVKAGAVEHDPQTALPLALQAVEIQPNNPEFLHTLGVVYYRLGMHEKAIETLQGTLELYESGAGTAGALFFLAMAEWQLGNRDHARTLYHDGIKWTAQSELSDHFGDLLNVHWFEAAKLLAIPDAPQPMPRNRPAEDRR